MCWTNAAWKATNEFRDLVLGALASRVTKKCIMIWDFQHCRTFRVFKSSATGVLRCRMDAVRIIYLKDSSPMVRDQVLFESLASSPSEGQAKKNFGGGSRRSEKMQRFISCFYWSSQRPTLEEAQRSIDPFRCLVFLDRSGCSTREAEGGKLMSKMEGRRREEETKAGWFGRKASLIIIDRAATPGCGRNQGMAIFASIRLSGSSASTKVYDAKKYWLIRLKKKVCKKWDQNSQ